MKTGQLVLVALAALAAPGFLGAGSVGDIYKNRCANCHGIKADGVPKIKAPEGVSPEDANTYGTVSQKKLDIYGPPLNHFSKNELLHKLMDIRGKNFDGDTYHAVMGDNLKKVEKRDGKIDDDKMAEYIYKNFGNK